LKNLEEDKGKDSNPITIKGISLLASPINLVTPISIISLGFYYSSLQLMNFDDVVVPFGEYYFRKSKRGITKRSTKRKKTEGTPN
jgi:hypothetical protein